MNHNEQLQKLSERFNELRNKQASLKGLLEAREKERNELKDKLISQGFSEEDLNEEKAAEMSSSLEIMIDNFNAKLNAWEEELHQAKQKLL